MTDTLYPPNFQHNLLSRTLLDGKVRAASVHLGSTWLDIVGQRQLPHNVVTLLGELSAASVLLAATLKFNGSLVLQLQGDSQAPIALIVVECDAQMRVRAAVKLRDEIELDPTAQFMQLLNPLGQGRFIVVLDPADKLPGQQAYTSLVPLLGHSVSHCLDYYMAHSEQLPTRIVLAANAQQCAGLLVQRMPHTGGTSTAAPEDVLAQAETDDTWVRVRHFVNTLKDPEMLSTDAPTILHRLFWDENPTPAQHKAVTFACTCSREKVGNMLKMLGTQEIAEALSEQEHLDINCEYCDTLYIFDAVDCAALFTGHIPTDGQVH